MEENFRGIAQGSCDKRLLMWGRGLPVIELSVLMPHSLPTLGVIHAENAHKVETLAFTSVPLEHDRPPSTPLTPLPFVRGWALSENARQDMVVAIDPSRSYRFVIQRLPYHRCHVYLSSLASDEGPWAVSFNTVLSELEDAV